MRIAIALFLIACLTSLTTGCGVRGPLEPPPGVESKAGAGDGLVTEDEGRDRTFILDGLLD